MPMLSPCGLPVALPGGAGFAIGGAGFAIGGAGFASGGEDGLLAGLCGQRQTQQATGRGQASHKGNPLGVDAPRMALHGQEARWARR